MATVLVVGSLYCPTTVGAVEIKSEVGSARRYEISVPRLTVDQALLLLGQQTGEQILFSFDQVRSLHAQPVNGKYTLAQALALLLKDTGLSIGLSESGINTVSLEKKSKTVDRGNTMQRFRKGLLAGLVSFFSGVAAAQDNAGVTKAGLIIEEVLVTASKRETTLQDTPMALSALSGEFLEEQGMFGLEDFAASVPGLQFQSLGGPGLSRVTIRGMSSVSGAATVSIYFDEMPVTSPVSQQTQPDFSLVDIQRVEVLRGPQGTLWGEGALGGTIRYITNKPDSSGFSGKVGAEWGTITDGGNLASVNVMLNIPLAEDTAALRLVGYYRDQDGWIDNTRLGIEDANDSESLGFRAQLLLTPNERFSALASLYYSDFESGAYPIQPIPTALESGVRDWREEEYTQGSLKLEYELDGLDLVSVTSYLDRPREIYIGTPALGLDGALGNPSQFLVTAGTIDIESLTQELRIVSSSDSRLQYTAGGFYKDLERDFFVALAMDPATPNGLFIPGSSDLFNLVNVVSYEQWAIFGEATYSIDSQWTVLVGMRYTDETVDQNDLNNNGLFAFPPFIPAQQMLSSRQSYSSLTPKFTVSFDPNEDLMLYGTVSEGFRSGGNNSSFPGTEFESYDEDSAINYEFGWKATLADGRVAFNGAIYYIDWTDLQALGDPIPGNLLGARAVQNIGEAHSSGIEMELIANITASLEVSLNGNWIEAELDKAATIAVAEEGNSLPLVPDFSVSASANYSFTVGNGLDGRIGGSVQHVVSRFQNMANTLELDAYTMVNLRASITAEDNWSVTLFADNVTDEEAFYDAAGEVAGFYTNRPRMIGLRVSKSF